MITRKDKNGRSWYAYADKTIVAGKHFIPSLELIQVWKIIGWNKKDDMRADTPLNARSGKD